MKLRLFSLMVLLGIHFMFRCSLVPACLVALLCCICISSCVQAQPHAFPLGKLGVSLAGAEFGVESDSFNNEQPGVEGTDYIVNSSASVKYFSRFGIHLVRLPFRWERIQPELGRPLDPKHLRELKTFCQNAAATNAKVVLDLHNYGRYRLAGENGLTHEYIIDQRFADATPVSRQDLADLWRRLALAFRTEASIAGYGIMNEPHDMGQSDWKVISQSAVDAIRKVDTKTTIVVAGDDWSSAERFLTANGRKAWIRDPQKNIVYEAHCYFDKDGSGKYQLSYRDEEKKHPRLVNRGVDRVKPFLDWCKANDVPGFIGEFGTPRTPEWREVTTRFVKECLSSDVSVCYWAAGEWWGEYPLSIHPGEESSAPSPQVFWMKAAASSRTAFIPE